MKILVSGAFNYHHSALFILLEVMRCEIGFEIGLPQMSLIPPSADFDWPVFQCYELPTISVLH